MDNSHEPGLNPITRGCYPAVALPGSKSGTPVDKPVFTVSTWDIIFGDQSIIGEVELSVEATGHDSISVVDLYNSLDLDPFFGLAGFAQATREHRLRRGSANTGNTQEEKWSRSLTCLQTAVRMKSLR